MSFIHSNICTGSYIEIVHRLIHSAGRFYSISSSTKKESSARMLLYITLHSSFVTENKVVTVLLYTLINLGINT